MMGRSYRLSALTGGFLFLVLVASFLSYGYVTSTSEARSHIEQLRVSHLLFSAEVAHGCAYYMVLGDYAGLDHYLEGIARIGDVLSISVIDAEGNPLSELIGTGESPRVPAAIPSPFPVPSEPDTTIASTATAMDIVTPIISVKQLGWLKASFDMASIEEMKTGIWRRSLAMGAVWTVLSLALTLILLRYPASAIRRLAAFASGLPMLQGGEVEIPHRIEELRELGEALNFASRELHSKERLLRRERDLLKEAQRVARISSWDWDAVNDVIWWSDEYYRIYGFDPNVPAPNYTEHLKAYTPESAARLDELVRRAMETGEPYELDMELSAPTESTRWIVAQGEVKRDADGMICGLRGTAQDITGRKQAEAELRRLNRELRAISNCNQVLIHAVDEQTLVEEVCRIICEDAGYRMAWVGYAEEDDAKTIRPVAWAGVEDGYLEQANISWADTELGRGPSGTAIRTGQPACTQDFSTDPTVAVWRSTALARGYRSSIALPLKGEGDKPFGVLNIYSTEPHAFSLNEIRLMEELSGDLSFGITVLRTRIERELAQWEVALMSFALDNVGESAFLTDEHARFRYVNKESCRELGYEREELLRLSVMDIDPDFPSERWPDHLAELKARGSLLFEGRHRARDGRIIPVEINANYFEYGGRGYNLALVRDITERKRMERYLRMLDVALDRSSESVFFLHYPDRIFHVNDEACRALGYSREELVSMTTSDIDADIKPEDLSEIIATGDASDGEIMVERYHRRKDGSTFPVEIHATRIKFEGESIIVSRARDITERRLAEQSLRASEARLNEAQRIAHIGSWELDIVANVLEWSDEIYRIFEIDRAKFGASYEAFLDAIHPDDRQMVDDAYTGSLRDRRTYDIVHRLLMPDGRVKYVRERCETAFDPDGTPLRSFGTVQDITAYMEAEEALRLRESQYRTLVENIPDMIVRYNTDLCRTYVNPAWERLSGLSRGEVIDLPMGEIPKVKKPVNVEYVAKLREVLETGTLQSIAFSWENAKGDVLHLDYLLVPEFDHHGEVVSVLAVGHDITERIRAEEAISRLNERLNLAVEAANIGVWDWDIQSNSLVWDDRMYALYGIGREDFGGAYEAWLGEIHPEDRAASDEISKRALAGEVPYDTEFRVVWPDGSVHNLKAYALIVRDADGTPVRMTGVNYDITDRRRMEEVTRARLRILEAAYTTDAPLGDALTRTLDEIEALTNSHIGFYHFLEEDQVTLSLQRWSTNTLASMCSAEGQGLHYPVSEAGVWADCVRERRPVIHNDYGSLPNRKGVPEGHARVLRELVVPIFRSGRIVAVIGVGNKPQDYNGADIMTVSLIGDFSWEIVVRKRAEEAYRASLSRFVDLFNKAAVPLCFVDKHSAALTINPRFERTFGYTREDIPTLDEWWQRAYPDLEYRKEAQEVCDAALQRAMTSGSDLEPIEYRVTCKNGDVRTMVVYGGYVGEDLLLTFFDVTEQKNNLLFLESLDKVNRAIQGADEHEQMMSDALGAILDIFGCDRAFLMYPCDPDADTWSVPMERTLPEYPGVLAQGLVMPMDADVARTLRVLLSSDGPVKFGPGTENPLPADVSEQFGFQCFMAMAIRPAIGSPWQFGLHQCSYARQWTAAEERLFKEIGHRIADSLSTLLANRDLRISEGNLAETQRIAHVGYWGRDLEAGRIELSAETCRIFGLPDEGLELGLEKWHAMWVDLLHPEDRDAVARAYEAAIKGGAPYKVEYRVVRSDGAIRHVHSEANVTRDERGHVLHVLGMMQDITERKQHEEQIARSLKEKDVLLAEVHHRVKNNMAIISALLRMQSTCVKDPDALAMFRECQSRIMSMALVHEQLYVTKDFAHVDVREYLLSLASSVNGMFSGGRQIEVSVECVDVALEIDVLIPCGLIVNELLTNAAKYAFMDVSAPRIAITLAELEDSFLLRISDNGVGLPDGFDIALSGGLGLKLVGMLSEQIEGTLSYQCDGGTTFSLLFPKNIAFARGIGK